MKILAYTSINSSMISKDGAVICQNSDNEDFEKFTRRIYKYLEVTYPKFFKMDELSKLAFIAGESLMKKIDLDNIELDKVAILLGNKSSSLATDRKHYESYRVRNNYFPSPAVFVYTLPNIMIGELCIRHKFTGENSCFISDEYNTDFFHNYVKHLFENEKYNYCITGWVNYEAENYEAHLFLVSNTNADTGIDFDHTYKNLIQID